MVETAANAASRCADCTAKQYVCLSQSHLLSLSGRWLNGCVSYCTQSLEKSCQGVHRNDLGSSRVFVHRFSSAVLSPPCRRLRNPAQAKVVIFGSSQLRICNADTDWGGFPSLIWHSAQPRRWEKSMVRLLGHQPLVASPRSRHIPTGLELHFFEGLQ